MKINIQKYWNEINRNDSQTLSHCSSVQAVAALERLQQENDELKKVIKLVYDWVEMDLGCNIRDAIAYIPKGVYIKYS